MKKIGFAALALTLITGLVAYKGSPTLEIGSKAPMTDAKMKDVSGKMMSLDDLKGDKGLLVIFSCNTCPFVIGWEDTYPGLGNLTAENDMGMVLINSNEAKREGDDSFDAMKEHYKEAGYNTPYILDSSHKLADAFGGKTTPHIYLFDGDMNLVYRGAISNKYESAAGTTINYLEDAINQMAKGEEISTPVTKERGCSIKRVKV